MTITLTQLTTPEDRVYGASLDVSWSAGAQFLATGNSSSPYLGVHRRIDDELERCSVSSTPPTWVQAVEWAPDSVHLAVGTGAPYQLLVYQRDGLSLSRVGQHAYTSGSVSALSWSPDGVYLAAANRANNLVRIYKNDGGSLTLLQALTDRTGGAPEDVSFSPDGSYVAIASAQTPFFNVYRRDDDVFTKLSPPSVLPGGFCYALDWSYDSAYLALAADVSNGATVNVYAHSGDTFTSLCDPVLLDVSQLGGLKWSDGAHTFVASTTLDNSLFFFHVSDGSIELELDGNGDPFWVPPDIRKFIDWSPGANFLAVTQHASAVGFTWYRIDGIELPESDILGDLYVEELLDALDATGQIPIAIYGAMFEDDDGASVYGTLYQRTTSTPGAYARYLCTLSDLVLPISSLSSRMASGEQSYLSIVVPDADRYRAEILARAGGWLKVYRIAYDASGTQLSTTLIASTKHDSVRFHSGASSGSAQLSGRAVAVTDEHLIVPLEGVSSVASHDGMLVVRSTPSAVLRPGHTALVPRVDGGEDQLEVESISFGANTQGESFEITGRMI